MYGTTPFIRFFTQRKSPKTRDICRALAKTAKRPPPTVALQTQKVVQAFQRTKQA